MTDVPEEAPVEETEEPTNITLEVQDVTSEQKTEES